MIIIVTEKQTVPGAFKVISITSNKIIFYNLRKRRQKVIQIESFAEVKDLKDDEFYLTYGKVNIITLFQLMTKVCDGKIVFDDKSGFKIGPKTLRGLLKDIVNVFCKKNEMGLLFSKSKKEYTVFK